MASLTLLKNEFPSLDPDVIKSILKDVGGDAQRATAAIRDSIQKAELAALKEQKLKAREQHFQELQEQDPPKVKKSTKSAKLAARKRTAAIASAVAAAFSLWACIDHGVFKVHTPEENYIKHLLFSQLELVSCPPEFVIEKILRLNWRDDSTGAFIIKQLLKPHKLSTHAIEKYAKVMEGVELSKPMLFSVVLDNLLERLRDFIEGRVSHSSSSSKTSSKKVYVWGAPTLEGTPMQQGSELSSSSVRKLFLKQEAQKVVAKGILLGFLNRYNVVTDAVICEVVIMLCKYLPVLDDPESTTRLQTACAILDNCKPDSSLIKTVVPLLANYASTKDLSSDVMGAVLQTVNRITKTGLTALAEQAQSGSSLPPLWFSYMKHLTSTVTDTSDDSEGDIFINGIGSQTLWPVTESWAAVRVPEGDPEAEPSEQSSKPKTTGMGRGKVSDEANIQQLLNATIIAERTAAKLRPAGRGTLPTSITTGIIPRRR